MDSTIISVLISSAVTLVVCLITNAAQHKKTEALMEYKLDALTKQVEKHNSIIERVFQLEKKAEIFEEKISAANHRINDLEKA